MAATTYPALIDYPNGQASLASTISAADTTIAIVAGQGAALPSSNFYVVIDSEQILISSRSVDTLTASTRGANGTSAASHVAGSTVSVSILKAHFDALGAAIGAIEIGSKALDSATVTGALTVGGGYGATGVTISSAGNVQANGTLTVDGAASLFGGALAAGSNGASGFTRDRGLPGSCIYHSLLHNALFLADSRASVTLTNFTSPSANTLFNGSDEDSASNTIAANTSAVVSIDLSGKSEYTSSGITYPEGYIYLTFYGGTGLGSNLTISGRYQDNVSAWHNMTYVGTVATGSAGYGITYGLSIPSTYVRAVVLEITITTGASPTQYGLAEIEYRLLRPSSSILSLLDKYSAQSIYKTWTWRSSSNAATVTVAASGDLTLAGDLAVNGGDLASTASTFNLLASPTTINVGAAATIVSVGKDNTTTINLKAGIIASGQTSLTLFNSTATTVNAFGAATTISLGAATGTTTINNALTVTGALTANGNVTLGDASTDTITCNGRLIVRAVTDAGPMTATNGTAGEIVRNTSDNKFYGCTATGTPATWAALN